MPTPDTAYTDIRDAVRALCAEFPAEYHRKIDAQRGYPEAFVNALTQAGMTNHTETTRHTKATSQMSWANTRKTGGRFNP